MGKTKRSSQAELKELNIFETVKQNIAAMGFAPNQQQQSEKLMFSRYQSVMIAILSMDLSTLCVIFSYGINGTWT